MSTSQPLLNGPREEAAEAQATFRRLRCYGRNGDLGSMTRTDLLLAEAEMRDMLIEALEAGRPGWPTPGEVRVVGRLTRRQWIHALGVTVFAGADLVPAGRRPEGVLPSHTRHWAGVDWIMESDLPGSNTRRAVCDLTAHAAGKAFRVELVADDTAPVTA